MREICIARARKRTTPELSTIETSKHIKIKLTTKYFSYFIRNRSEKINFGLKFRVYFHLVIVVFDD